MTVNVLKDFTKLGSSGSNTVLLMDQMVELRNEEKDYIPEQYL
jgi:hypothetical protein